MRLTYHWLQRYLENSSLRSDILALLPSIGIEVEEAPRDKSSLEGFVVARIVSVAPHPQADRLRICQVDIGKNELIHVVCGASNVRQGLVSVFAPIGVTIPLTKSVLKKGVIRGIESHGMLCSKEELLLKNYLFENDHDDGIIELDPKFKPGTLVETILEKIDVVFDVSLTPNRGDWFSVRGLAKELSLFSKGSFADIEPNDYAVVSQKSPYADAPFFSTILVEGKLKNHPLFHHLYQSGYSALNPAVDLTNFLALDLGFPFHVYDYEKIQGNIRIGLSRGGEIFEALNNKTYELPAHAITIEDDCGIISLAGIIGSKRAACTDDTTRFLFEFAVFDPVKIASAGQAICLQTEARTRFERGVDAKQYDVVLNYALDLIKQMEGTFDVEQIKSYKSAIQEKKISFDWKIFTKKTGIEISYEKAKSLLAQLQLSYNEGRISIPTHRHDMHEDVDVVEDMLRLHGYGKLPMNSLPKENPVTYKKNPILERLVHLGYEEIVSVSFSKEDGDFWIKNPLSQEWQCMRRSLLPSLISYANEKRAHGKHDLKIVECANIYKRELANKQTPSVGALVMGRRKIKGPFDAADEFFDFFDIKGDLGQVLSLYGVTKAKQTPEGPKIFHPYQVTTIMLGTRVIGYMGQVHPVTLKNAYAFELFPNELPPHASYKVPKKASPYPEVTRDFCFVLEEDILSEAIERAIVKVSPLVKSAAPFDVHENSITFRVILGSDTHTLEETEISTVYQSIVGAVECLGVRLKML